MADKIVLLDSTILIDYYRKVYKDRTRLVMLVKQDYKFAISAVTKYEIYSGATAPQLDFWDKVFQTIPVLTFDEICVDLAVTINADLKRKRKQIAISDLFIAATAIKHNLPIATSNVRHFDRIEGLELI
jgi:tRNA(fMet)-specific endonuclease VapC